MFLSYGRDIGYSVTQFVYIGAVYSIFLLVYSSLTLDLVIFLFIAARSVRNILVQNKLCTECISGRS